MTKDLAKKRKKDLGIFYTPQEVVDFIFDVLNMWKNKEDKEKHRWQTRKSKPHFPSVIDPACGEGIFLKKAVESKFTTPSYIWGVDIDESVKQRWQEINLLKSFGSKANLDFHFYHQDGLLPIPEKKVGHKRGGMNQYDAVVGNPPYGGIGINEITPELEKALFDFQIWGVKFQKNQKDSPGNLGLFGTTIPRHFKRKIENFPIEILFIDRFIQLAKPGGWVAIIIPDGILTNSNSHYVREFISHKTKVEAIISLPRNTFKDVGTSAKTSILFLRKLKKDEKPEENYPVFLASLEKIDQKYLDTIVNYYQKHYNLGDKNMDNPNKVQITQDQNKREAVMVRVDKTLRELMEEKPQSRWDAKYWHPKYDYLSSYKTHSSFLKDLLENKSVISADTIRASRGESYVTEKNKEHPYRYYSVAGILKTGYDFEQKEYGSKNAYNRLKRSELKDFDIAIARSGTGSLGKSFIFLGLESPNIVSDLYIVRSDAGKINPFYVLLLLKTKFGNDQISRNEKGVSGQTKLTRDMIEDFLVPNVSIELQKRMESGYRKVLDFHKMAMEAKKNGDGKNYRKNLEVAEKLLRDLIKRTEDVIKGKREDIN